MIVLSLSRDDLAPLCDPGTRVYSAVVVFVANDQSLRTVPQALTTMPDTIQGDNDPEDLIALCYLPLMSLHMPCPTQGDILVAPADDPFSSRWFGTLTDFSAYDLLRTTVQSQEVVVIPPIFANLASEKMVSFTLAPERGHMWLNAVYQVPNPASGAVESAQHLVYLRAPELPDTVPHLPPGVTLYDEYDGFIEPPPPNRVKGVSSTASATVTSSSVPDDDIYIEEDDGIVEMPTPVAKPDTRSVQADVHNVPTGPTVNQESRKAARDPASSEPPRIMTAEERKEKAKEELIPMMQDGFDALSAHIKILLKGYGELYGKVMKEAKVVHSMAREQLTTFTSALKDGLSAWSDAVSVIQTQLGTPNLESFNQAVATVQEHTKTLQKKVDTAVATYENKEKQEAIDKAYENLPAKLNEITSDRLEAICNRYIDKTLGSIFDKLFESGATMEPFVTQAAGLACQLRLAITGLQFSAAYWDRQLENCLTGQNQVLFSLTKNCPSFSALAIPALDNSILPVALPSSILATTTSSVSAPDANASMATTGGWRVKLVILTGFLTKLPKAYMELAAEFEHCNNFELLSGYSPDISTQFPTGLTGSEQLLSVCMGLLNFYMLIEVK